MQEQHIDSIYKYFYMLYLKSFYILFKMKTKPNKTTEIFNLPGTRSSIQNNQLISPIGIPSIDNFLGNFLIDIMKLKISLFFLYIYKFNYYFLFCFVIKINTSISF